MSVKGLASPQLLAHNEVVIFTDHLSQEAYWGRGRKTEGRRGVGWGEGKWGVVGRRGIGGKEKRQEKKMNVQLPGGSADVDCDVRGWDKLS